MPRRRNTTKYRNVQPRNVKQAVKAKTGKCEKIRIPPGTMDLLLKNKSAHIPEWYSGRTIFITGATGFMGKVLVERLLATCPDIRSCLLLMREKKNVLPTNRLDSLKQSPIFDVIRQKCPSQLDKLHIIPGDLSCPGLGLSAESTQQLSEVSVVFHSAATVKFMEPLRKAVDINVRSVIAIMDLCDSLKSLEAFVYVSTAYCNFELAKIEERIYETRTNPHYTLDLINSLSDDELESMIPKLIHPKPNTYLFTKAMAERVVELRHRRYPTATRIFRPAIVTSSLRHPFPGWTENWNGPNGVIAATMRGMLGVFVIGNTARADLIPVDIAVDTLIGVAWEIALEKSNKICVYNCSSNENPVTWLKFKIEFIKNVQRFPSNNVFLYPTLTTFENKFIARMFEAVFQTLPLYIMEYISRLLRIKTQVNLIMVSHMLQAMKALQDFSVRDWSFDTDNVKRLRMRLSPQDAAIYNLDPNTINWVEYTEQFVRGVRRHLLKESEKDLDRARKRLHKLFLLRCITYLGTFGVFFWFLLRILLL